MKIYLFPWSLQRTRGSVPAKMILIIFQYSFLQFFCSFWVFTSLFAFVFFSAQLSLVHNSLFKQYIHQKKVNFCALYNNILFSSLYHNTGFKYYFRNDSSRKSKDEKINEFVHVSKFQFYFSFIDKVKIIFIATLLWSNRYTWRDRSGVFLAIAETFDTF